MSHYHFRENDAPKGLCQRCGFEFNLSALKREWTGLLVCHGADSNDCWDPRQPQDYVRGVADRQSIKNPSPEPQDSFLSPGDVDPTQF